MAKEWLSVAHGHGFGFQKPLLWLPALAPVCGGHEPAMTSHKRLSHKLSPVKHVTVSAQVSPTIIFFSSSLSFRLVMPLFLFKGQFFRYFPLMNVQAVDEFIYELGLKESNIEKRRKIDSLALHEDEWTRVRLFCNLLQVSSVIYIFEYY